MAHVTPEEEAAFTQVMQLLESQPEDTTTSPNTLVSVTNDDNIPAQREKLAVPVSTGKSKEAMNRLNALLTKRYKSTPKGMKPTSATRPLSL